MDILEHIRKQVSTENYEFSLHAEHEREDEHILVEELEQSVRSGQLLEDYPDDPSGLSERALERAGVEALAGEKVTVFGQNRLKPGLRSASPTNS